MSVAQRWSLGIVDYFRHESYTIKMFASNRSPLRGLTGFPGWKLDLDTKEGKLWRTWTWIRKDIWLLRITVKRSISVTKWHTSKIFGQVLHQSSIPSQDQNWHRHIPNMRQFRSILLLLVPFTEANFDKIKSVLLNLEKAAYNKTSATNLFQQPLLETLENIKKYGCWCYFRVAKPRG